MGAPRRSTGISAAEEEGEEEELEGGPGEMTMQGGRGASE